MTSTKARAPTLFGKRMRWSESAKMFIASGFPFEVVVDYFRAGEWFAYIPGVLHGRYRATPQAAARDAERYLRRLHAALGRVCDATGK